MRIHGTLIRWNDDRGFGFIETAAGSEELFVHISAFPRGARPQVGELVSFEIEMRGDGQKRAIRLMGPDSARTTDRSPHQRRTTTTSTSRRPVVGTAWLAIACVIVALAVHAYRGRVANHAESLEPMQTMLHSMRAAAPLARGAAASAPAIRPTLPAAQPALPVPATAVEMATSFSCGGRTMCSQMTSCAEATWVLNHCPGVRMDGDNDGVPCEQQWCGR